VSRVNLLPPQIREAEDLRRRTSLVALIGAAVLVAVGFLYFLQVANLNDARARLESQQAENARLQEDIADLQRFAQLRADLEQARDLVSAVFRNEVAWSGVLLDVSRVIPPQAALTSFSGAVTAVPAEGEAEATEGTRLVGDLQFAGQAFDEETLAVWLTQLEQVRGWVNPWLPNASETAPRSNIYTFQSSVDLSMEVVTRRGRGGEAP
jgi:Tfp pilus assembly protein PilN